jgi:hypothetical protein
VLVTANGITSDAHVGVSYAVPIITSMAVGGVTFTNFNFSGGGGGGFNNSGAFFGGQPMLIVNTTGTQTVTVRGQYLGTAPVIYFSFAAYNGGAGGAGGGGGFGNNGQFFSYVMTTGINDCSVPAGAGTCYTFNFPQGEGSGHTLYW